MFVSLFFNRNKSGHLKEYTLLQLLHILMIKMLKDDNDDEVKNDNDYDVDDKDNNYCYSGMHDGFDEHNVMIMMMWVLMIMIMRIIIDGIF